MAYGKSEKDVNCIYVDYRTESFEIVKTNFLFDTLSDELSLLTVDGAVRMGLEMVHPFAAEDMHVGVRNELLGSIVK